MYNRGVMVGHIKSHSELIHSRQINVHKACYNNEMWVFRDNIYKLYIEPLKKYKENIAKNHLKKILIDIYQSWYFDPTLCLAVSFNNNDHTLHARYNKNRITKKTIELIKDLVKLNLLYYKAGIPAKGNYHSGPSYTSRIWPTEHLIKYFLEIKFNIINISSHDIDKETVILNKKEMIPDSCKKPGGKARYKNIPIDYSETPKIKAMRLVLACYNLLLRKTHIDVATAENYYLTGVNGWGRKTSHFIEPNNFMHRVFSNGTFNNGGRIYGGWWQKCPSAYRKDILINGNPVVEVTYNAVYLGILYKLEGLNLYDMTAGRDFYDVNIPELDNVTELELKEYTHKNLINFKRFIIKVLIQNAIVATNKTDLWKATIKAVRSEARTVNGEIQKPPPNILKIISYKFLASVFDRVKQKYSLVSHYFLAGLAPRLQLIESNMEMNLIEHFTALKVPILTLHDSYIVEQKWGQTLINTMQCSWLEEMHNLGANPRGLPKRSKHLERLTSHENHYATRHLLAEPRAVRLDHEGGRDRLRLFSKIFARSSRDEKGGGRGMQKIFEERWSKSCANIVRIKPTVTSGVCTKRHQASLKRHREWLLEGDTEDDSPEIRARYKRFYAGISSRLYLEWLRSKPLWMDSKNTDIEREK